MIPKECKRLIEVDFPIAPVSRYSEWEKNNFPKGHPKSIHQWWARRPLAACRAVLMGLLMPDPCDEHCPEDFKAQARLLLPKLAGNVGKSSEDLRAKLLKFIADFSNWDHSAHPTYLEVARGLVKAAHGEEPPLVVDPFAGGGSIPLEALRLGCDAFASDLNPVACLILKVLLEDIPRHGRKLVDELRRVGAEIKAAAEKELSEFYPPDPDGSKPIAYLWTRTVTCETPGCGAEIPLVRSLWLSKKAGRKRALRYKVVRERGKAPKVEFELYEPKKDSDVPKGTVDRGNAKCICCETVLPVERVRQQLVPRHGGADDARLLAVVTLKEQTTVRQYRLPSQLDYDAVKKARKVLAEIAANRTPTALNPIPDEPLPPQGTLGFRVQRYGITTWGDLFTARQKLSLSTCLTALSNVTAEDSIREAFALSLGKLIGFSSAQSTWNITNQNVANAFGRQALPMVWDFAEVPLFGEEFVTLPIAIEYTRTVTDQLSPSLQAGSSSQVMAADACSSPLPDSSSPVWFTDPPYYDSVPYADLSDFFYVWLKRALPRHPLFKSRLTPKQEEIIQDEVQQVDSGVKDKDFFERQMAVAFKEGRRTLSDEGIGCVVFAHKTTEGWEALLSGMLKGGWTITGSWPISTERPGRLRAQESAALSASVHLICRPRPQNAGTGDWTSVYNEMKDKVANWMERLAEEGVRGADLVFACIGPALEVYSRYEKVVDANDREIPLGGDPLAAEPYQRGYLSYIWEVVGRTALEQVLGTAEARARNGAAGVLEEDARLTALFLWTLMSSTAENGNGAKPEDDEDEEEAEEEKGGKKKAGYSLVYDVARRFSQPLGIDLDKWKGRIIEIEKGVVRLIPIKERAKQLFGEDSLSKIAAKLEKDKADIGQLILFADEDAPIAPRVKSTKVKRERKTVVASDDRPREATTLDRVHAAMLLQASGQAAALKALIESEQKRGPDFLRLANALSALYPKNSEEKRLLDAMLLAVPRR
jgi:putative DNA methylase